MPVLRETKSAHKPLRLEFDKDELRDPQLNAAFNALSPMTPDSSSTTLSHMGKKLHFDNVLGKVDADHIERVGRKLKADHPTSGLGVSLLGYLAKKRAKDLGSERHQALVKELGELSEAERRQVTFYADTLHSATEVALSDSSQSQSVGLTPETLAQPDSTPAKQKSRQSFVMGFSNQKTSWRYEPGKLIEADKGGVQHLIHDAQKQGGEGVSRVGDTEFHVRVDEKKGFRVAGIGTKDKTDLTVWVEDGDKKHYLSSQKALLRELEAARLRAQKSRLSQGSTQETMSPQTASNVSAPTEIQPVESAPKPSKARPIPPSGQMKGHTPTKPAAKRTQASPPKMDVTEPSLQGTQYYQTNPSENMADFDRSVEWAQNLANDSTPLSPELTGHLNTIIADCPIFVSSHCRPINDRGNAGTFKTLGNKKGWEQVGKTVSADHKGTIADDGFTSAVHRTLKENETSNLGMNTMDTREFCIIRKKQRDSAEVMYRYFSSNMSDSKRTGRMGNYVSVAIQTDNNTADSISKLLEDNPNQARAFFLRAGMEVSEHEKSRTVGNNKKFDVQVLMPTQHSEQQLMKGDEQRQISYAKDDVNPRDPRHLVFVNEEVHGKARLTKLKFFRQTPDTSQLTEVDPTEYPKKLKNATKYSTY